MATTIPTIPTIYLIIKMKTVVDSSTGGYACVTDQPIQRSTREGAEESYYTALAEAARSKQYPIIGAMLTTNYGDLIAKRVYVHEQPETE